MRTSPAERSGKHKMIPWLSPGKTWEGFVRRHCVLSVIVGVGLATGEHSNGLTESDHVPDVAWGGSVAWRSPIVGQFGDLTMSLLKRGAGLKDSSKLLPGLGGVMDVLDSPLLVAPVAFWMLTMPRPDVQRCCVIPDTHDSHLERLGRI